MAINPPTQSAMDKTEEKKELQCSANANKNIKQTGDPRGHHGHDWFGKTTAAQTGKPRRATKLHHNAYKSSGIYGRLEGNPIESEVGSP
jgi:hypothetical protein